MVISKKEHDELEEIAALFDAQDKSLNAAFIRHVSNRIIEHEMLVQTKLNEYKFSKIDHQKSNQCEHPRSCSACHFWSGAIEGLNDLINPI